jgi:hypothetical protein
MQSIASWSLLRGVIQISSPNVREITTKRNKEIAGRKHQSQREKAASERG